MINEKLIKYLNKFIICYLHNKYSYLIYIYKIDKEHVYYFYKLWDSYELHFKHYSHRIFLNDFNILLKSDYRKLKIF